MAKKSLYRCNNCGYESIGYLGKCPECMSWGTMDEVVEENTSSKSNAKSKTNSSQVKRLKEVEGLNSDRVISGISELDRVMGGGIVRDSVTILTARPGAGKSTLLLQLSNQLANIGYKTLYASGEESESQIKKRAERILTDIEDDLFVMSTNSLDAVISKAKELDVDALIVDSIQTFVLDEHLPSRAGSPTQSLECAYTCVEFAKDISRPRMVFLVGQMNKDDQLQGLRSIEHLVDTVLYIEGESGDPLRSLLATKNRYGSTGEMGFFEMCENGLLSIDNPSEYFMTVRDEPVVGSALGVIKEGTRPIVMEVETLMNKTFTPYPSRISESIKKDTLNIMISILEDRLKLQLFDMNVVLKAVGGLRTFDPSINFAIVMSVASSYFNKPIKNHTCFIGDISLTGEIRKAEAFQAKVAEADRMGFKEIAVSIRNKDIKTNNAKIIRFKNINEAIDYYFKGRN